MPPPLPPRGQGFRLWDVWDASREVLALVGAVHLSPGWEHAPAFAAPEASCHVLAFCPGRRLSRSRGRVNRYRGITSEAVPSCTAEVPTPALVLVIVGRNLRTVGGQA